jgi:DNA-binding MarR family transcriptional regulator
MRSKQLPVLAQPAQIQSVVDNYDRIVRQLTATRSAGIFESTVTMAQLKVLMLLGAKAETRMSELATDLHLSLSTVSGLVEKLVENGLAARRTDVVDRRQVLVSLTQQGATFLDRFQELGKDTLRALLEQLTVDELECVATAMNVLISAAGRMIEGETK